MKNIRKVILVLCIVTFGCVALQAQNTASGYGALNFDTSGNYNAAFGYAAAFNNTTGSDNSAFGDWSLFYSTTGSWNSAFGLSSLYTNTIGVGNTATGAYALYANTNGGENTATGYRALDSNTIGSQNTAIGPWALGSNGVGGSNIGIGYAAGYSNPYAASNNIDIGSWGTAYDYNTIRIGTPGVQSAFYVAGVRGTTPGAYDGIPVYIDSNGQLGTVSSSIRFKEDVHDMAGASDGLFRLRPVTYHYKQPYEDGSKPIDYGLIAEEVAEVYPDLVVRDADGQIQTVQYQKLTPMLLNEVQKEHRQLAQQEATIEKQGETIQLLGKRLAALETAQPSANLEARLAKE